MFFKSIVILSVLLLFGCSSQQQIIKESKSKSIKKPEQNKQTTNSNYNRKFKKENVKKNEKRTIKTPQKRSQNLTHKAGELRRKILEASSELPKQAKNNISVFRNKRNNSITVMLEKNVLFDFDKSKINSKFNTVLSSIADFVTTNPSYITTIRAYTDSVGKKPYNLKLSQDRANAVKSKLVRYNVPISRITAVGYGESHKYSNASSDGRAKNRRAEIEISKALNKVSSISLKERKKKLHLINKPTKPSKDVLKKTYSNRNFSIERDAKLILGNGTTFKTCSYSDVEKYSYISCAAKIGGCSVASKLLLRESPKAVQFLSDKSCDFLLKKTGFSSTHTMGKFEKIFGSVADFSGLMSSIFPNGDWAKEIDPILQYSAKIPAYYNCVEHSRRQNICF